MILIFREFHFFQEPNEERLPRSTHAHGAYRHYQQYFSYIVAVSFIGGGNWSIRRKPPTCRKSLTTLSHNVVSNTPTHERGSNSQLLVAIGTDCTGSHKSNYHTITTTTTPNFVHILTLDEINVLC